MAESSAALAFRIGEFVTIRVQDPRYSSTSELWEVKEIDAVKGSAVVYSETKKVSIQVKLANMDKLELAKVPRTCASVRAEDDDGVNVAVEKTWEYEQVCDIWRQLPGNAMSEFRFVRTTEPEDELAFYPVLRRYNIGLEFHSRYFSEYGIIRLQRTDVLAWCPGCGVWVLCYCCQKFLCPPEDHRNSKKHISTITWNRNLTAEEMYREYVSKKRVTRPLYHHGDDTMHGATSEM